MGWAVSVAFGSFGVFYGGVAVAALLSGERGGVDLGGRRPRLVVDGAAVDVDVRHVHVAVRHARRLVRARLATAPRPPRPTLNSNTPGRVHPFRIFHFHFTVPTKIQPGGRKPNRASLKSLENVDGRRDPPSAAHRPSGRRVIFASGSAAPAVWPAGGVSAA